MVVMMLLVMLRMWRSRSTMVNQTGRSTVTNTSTARSIRSVV